MGDTVHKSKRVRTSFKHHQLRTMKAYFAMNHNPDAKDLKQLSQKTGLTKRVLQVWFQNARAKYRRTVMTEDSSKASSIPEKEGSEDHGKENTLDDSHSEHEGSLDGLSSLDGISSIEAITSIDGL